MRALGVIVVLAAAGAAGAQIPVTQEPRHRVAFENASVRILDVHIPPGDVSLDHRHDFDLVTVSMADDADTRVQASGQAWGPVAPRRPLGDAAVVEYAGRPDSHRIENVGGRSLRVFAVENLRTSGWSAHAPLVAPATTVKTESRAFRVYDVRLAPDSSRTLHHHAVPTVVVLVSGVAVSEPADERATVNAASGRDRLDRPGQWMLIHAGESHHVARLGAGHAHVVEIEVR